MSIEAMSWVWKQDVKPAAAKLVLLALADHANPDGYCWPSILRIAGMVGLTSRQVSTHIRSLEAKGLVERGDRRRKDGQYRGWTYTLPIGSELPVATGSPATVTSGSGLPVRNPQENPKKNSRKRDYLFEAVASVAGHSLQTLTSSERGRLNRATKELREVGATPEDVVAAAKVWKQKYPNATLTATALAAHWSGLKAGRRSQPAFCPDCLGPMEGHSAEICELMGETR